MMVLLNDDEEMAKMFRFNDTYCYVYVSSNNELPAFGVIPFTSYTKFN